MTDERRITAAVVTRICRIFEELGVTLPELTSVSCLCHDCVCFKDYGKMPEDVDFPGSRRALPAGLHKYLPSGIEGITAVIVINTTVESGDFSSRWKKILRREADSDPFTIGDPVQEMLNELVNSGFFSIRGECFCSVGKDLREAYCMMIRALEGVICRGRDPRLKIIRDLPEVPCEGILSTQDSRSLFHRDRSARCGGHRYFKLKDDNLTFKNGDQK